MLQIYILPTLLYVAIAQTGPHLKLFDLPNSLGDFRVVQQQTKSLKTLDFQDKTSSYCVNNAAFIIYTENTFNNKRSNSGSFWTWSNGKNCFNVESRFDNRASSVRPVGDPSDFRRSSITLYEQEGFGGRAEIYFDSTQAVEHARTARSIILTGSDPWTLYEDEHYGGVADCIYPSVNNIPGFYPRSTDLGDFSQRVVSLAKGCRDPNQPNVSLTSSLEINSVTGSFTN